MSSYYDICRTEHPLSGHQGARIVRCGRPDRPHDVHWEVIDGEAGPAWTVPEKPAPAAETAFRDFWIDYPDEDWYGKVYCPRCDQVAFHASDGAGLGSLIDSAQQHAATCTGRAR